MSSVGRGEAIFQAVSEKVGWKLGPASEVVFVGFLRRRQRESSRSTGRRVEAVVIAGGSRPLERAVEGKRRCLISMSFPPNAGAFMRSTPIGQTPYPAVTAKPSPPHACPSPQPYSRQRSQLSSTGGCCCRRADVTGAAGRVAFSSRWKRGGPRT